jgi:hypothetical protein
VTIVNLDDVDKGLVSISGPNANSI